MAAHTDCITLTMFSDSRKSVYIPIIRKMPKAMSEAAARTAAMPRKHSAPPSETGPVTLTNGATPSPCDVKECDYQYRWHS